METETTKSLERLASFKEAEDLTGVSHWTWRRWSGEGRIETVKLGGRRLIPVKAIQDMIERNTQPARV